MNITDQELGLSEIFILTFPLPNTVYKLTLCATSFENAQYWAALWMKGRKMALPVDSERTTVMRTGSVIAKEPGTVLMEQSVSK